MILQTRDAKCYGTIHIDNYLEFIGFCKKVDSDEAQVVDVYLDGEKIESILANQEIPKITQIYDIKNHSFKFVLKDTYFEKSHLLEFKCDEEILVNSPVQTIDRNHPKFNEYKFFNELNYLEEDSISKLPNDLKKISTLINDEILEKELYVSYLKDMLGHFQKVEFNIFCFNDIQKKNLENIFDSYKNINIEIIQSPKQLIENSTIFIIFMSKRNLKMYDILFDSYSNLLTLYLNRLSNNILDQNNFRIHPRYTFNYESFSSDTLDKTKGIYSNVLSCVLNENITLEKDMNFFNFNVRMVELALENSSFIENYNQFIKNINK